VHADIPDALFESKCPSEASELEKIDSKPVKCPRCGKELEIREIKQLVTDSSAK